tara:strand:- start:78 stop:332 length:255 start_codon:yes stop_codon:yes gene_type:complete
MKEIKTNNYKIAESESDDTIRHLYESVNGRFFNNRQELRDELETLLHYDTLDEGGTDSDIPEKYIDAIWRKLIAGGEAEEFFAG